MIDINTIINEAFEKVIKEVVHQRVSAFEQRINQRLLALEEKQQATYTLNTRMQHWEGRVTALENRLSNWEAAVRLCASHEDLMKLDRAVGDLKKQVEATPHSNSTRLRLEEIEVQLNDAKLTMSTLQERFALKEDVEDALREKTNCSTTQMIHDSVNKLERRVNVIDSDTAENDDNLVEDVKQILRDLLDDDEDNIIAGAVAQAFQNGALTISVDKV